VKNQLTALISKTKLYAILALTTALPACGQYSFTLNEAQIYTPPLLFSAFNMEDKALNTCIQREIKEKKITAAGQLKELQCNNSGLKKLDGIELFAALEKLTLNNNQITDLSPLTALHSLQNLQLESNAIVDIKPLSSMPALRVIDLTDNTAIPCEDLQELSENWIGVIEKPEHCLTP
jgi:Leucine-rich repeat (LRR) protein